MADRCESCRYFTVVKPQTRPGNGQCRRFPRVPVKDEVENEIRAVFPLVLVSDWCGEYRPKEGAK